jgi:hypothetical protein
MIWIKLANMTGGVDWHDNPVHKIEIASDIAQEVYLDNFNFNFGYCWEAPKGILYIHEAPNASEEEPTLGQLFYATYEFDPYLASVPRNVKKASMCLAGAQLVEHLIGLRQSITAFEAQGDSAERIPDKEALFNTRAMLKSMAEKALDSVGICFDFDPIKG